MRRRWVMRSASAPAVAIAHESTRATGRRGMLAKGVSLRRPWLTLLPLPARLAIYAPPDLHSPPTLCIRELHCGQVGIESDLATKYILGGRYSVERISMRITGQTPLLVNRFYEEAQAEATSGTHSRSRDRPSPEEDAASRLYRLSDGTIYFPAENLRQSIIAAAGRHKIGRRSAVTDVAAALLIEPFAMPLLGDWSVDQRPVVIPATRGRVLRYRPIFERWSIEATLQVDLRLVDTKLLRRIVDDAGDYVGIGDFRPAKKGPYGRFVIDSWQPLQD
jgi:hypothetical protein